MPANIRQFFSLFIAVFFLFAGFGLFLNSAGVKLAQMGVGNIAIGALNAGFFLGAALSAVAGHRIISRVGHIRSFSVFGALFAISALAHLMVQDLWLWGVLRVMLGFCYYSMLMIVESWFAERSGQQARAKVLAIYNIVYYLSVTMGIGLLSLNLSSDNIFVMGSLLVIGSMLPVLLTRIHAPEIPPRQKINIPRVFSISPLAFATSFLAGMMVNGIFTMASVFLLQQHFAMQEISLYLTCAMVGGFLVQIPMAKLSDKYGRRNAIVFCALLSLTASIIALAAMFFGKASAMVHNGVAFTLGLGLFALYALSIARANDRLPNNMNTVEVSRSLLFCYGLGSLTAPLLLGIFTQYAPVYGFYGFYVINCTVLAIFAFRQPSVPPEERSTFVSMPGNTGSVMPDLDPRNAPESPLED